MTRALALLPLVVTGCFSMEPIDLGSGCDFQIFPGPCVDADHPLEFLDGDAGGLAEGGAAPLEILALDDLAFTVTSSDPAVAEVAAAPGGGFELRGRAAGDATIVARGSDGRQLDELWVPVRPIAAVEFRFDPHGAVALAELAALPGATELLRVVPLDDRGEPLRGAAGVVQLGFTGPLAAGAVAEAEPRGRQLQIFNAPRTVGFQAAVRFDALGPGAITAEIGGAPIATLPIEVIPAATTVALVAGSPTAPVGWLQVAGLVGTDARGVPVAGLVGDFAASPAGLVTIDDPHAGEVLMSLRAVGVVTVTATLPDRVVETSFEIAP